MKSVILIGLTGLVSAASFAQPGNRGIDNSSRQVTTKFEPKLIPSSKLVLDPIIPRSENPKINVKFETPEFAWNTRKIIRPVQPEKLKDKNSDSVYLSNKVCNEFLFFNSVKPGNKRLISCKLTPLVSRRFVSKNSFTMSIFDKISSVKLGVLLIIP